MALEIERKFLVDGEFKEFALSSHKIIQGYISSNPARSVRVRIKGDSAFLTIKGVTNSSGMSRYEWEKPISIQEAEELLLLCEPGVIDKVRYIVPFNGLTFEVDEFSGENLGLLIAEVELSSELQIVELPSWIGVEVTGDTRYYNSSLVKNPYKSWE
ncbi:MAG: CYTH domain-containing protein [Bacteroidales bacterium]